MERIGIGFDSHKFVRGRKLILGGVEIPFEKGLLGHSDGDALIHSIIDALLGAAHLGNIGRMFPDTDPKFSGADSLNLLEIVAHKISQEGFSVVNVDSVVIAEEPKLSSFVGKMEENIASVLKIPQNCTSVKPKTNEGMGFIGNGEGIAAITLVLLKK